MLIAYGELRKVEQGEYTNKKTGQIVTTFKVVIEPEIGQNIEIELTQDHISSGVVQKLESLKRKMVYMPFSEFHFLNGGSKKNLSGNGLPLEIQEKNQLKATG